MYTDKLNIQMQYERLNNNTSSYYNYNTPNAPRPNRYNNMVSPITKHSIIFENSRLKFDFFLLQDQCSSTNELPPKNWPFSYKELRSNHKYNVREKKTSNKSSSTFFSF